MAAKKSSPFGRPRGLSLVPTFRQINLTENISIQGEALAHETEALGHLLGILVDPNPHRVDLGWRQGFRWLV